MNDHRTGGTSPTDVESNEHEELPQEASPAAPEQVDQLRQERDDYLERLQRVTAEFDNYRKRTERERRETWDRAAASIVEELLPIVDDFERALSTEPGAETSAYREGVAIIHRQLMDLLGRRGVQPIQAVGQDFDPRWHQAVAHDPAPGHRDGEVLEELRRGYMLGDRLLRPSMVKVAKA
jgi:molecular chaperone GrpE